MPTELETESQDDGVCTHCGGDGYTSEDVPSASYEHTTKETCCARCQGTGDEPEPFDAFQDSDSRLAGLVWRGAVATQRTEPTECSICRGVHGMEVIHACE